MLMLSFFTCKIVHQFLLRSRTCGNSWSRAFRATRNAGRLLITAAREQALSQDPMKITSSMVFCQSSSELSAVEA